MCFSKEEKNIGLLLWVNGFFFSFTFSWHVSRGPLVFTRTGRIWIRILESITYYYCYSVTGKKISWAAEKKTLSPNILIINAIPFNMQSHKHNIRQRRISKKILIFLFLYRTRKPHQLQTLYTVYSWIDAN